MVWNDSKVEQDTAWKKQRLTGKAYHLIKEAVDLSKGDDDRSYDCWLCLGIGQTSIHDQADPYQGAPIVEAMAALVLANFYLRNKASHL